MKYASLEYSLLEHKDARTVSGNAKQAGANDGQRASALESRLAYAVAPDPDLPLNLLAIADEEGPIQRGLDAADGSEAVPETQCSVPSLGVSYPDFSLDRANNQATVGKCCNNGGRVAKAADCLEQLILMPVPDLNVVAAAPAVRRWR